jgi:hypothetical protein
VFDITDIIDGFYCLESTLKDPAPHDLSTDEIWDRVPRISSHHDEQHAKNKFPLATSYVIRKLGAANAKRREYLHFLRLRGETRRVDEVAPIADEVVPQSKPANMSRPTSTSDAKSLTKLSAIQSTIPSTELSSIFDVGVIGIDGATEPPQQVESLVEDGSDQISETSYAVTVNAKEGDVRLRMPKPPPPFYYNSPFDCPYCSIRLAHVNTEKDWKYVLRQKIDYFVANVNQGGTFSKI